MMRGWMMPSHRGMSSHLISGAATQGVPPMLSPPHRASKTYAFFSPPSDKFLHFLFFFFF